MSHSRAAFLSLRKLEVAKKSLERKDSAVVLADDPAATRVAAIWPNLEKAIDDDAQLGRSQVLEPRIVVAYYWNVVEFKLEELAALAGLPLFLVDQKFRLLRTQLLVWPDGSLAESVRKLLETQVDFAHFDRTTASVRIGTGRRPPRKPAS